MGSSQVGKSHAMAWVLTIAIVPVLYVVSLGPVSLLYRYDMLSPAQRQWLELFYKPLDWLVHL